MREIPAESIDAIVTDPPYGLSSEPDTAEVLTHWLAGNDYKHRGGGFMGNTWDSFVPGPTTWREAYRPLKPGGHLVAFFGTRTYDLGVLAIRLAGFEIRDQIAWMFGQGFPKSHNLDGEWKGWGTALKPGFEPIVVARKPLSGTVAANASKHGTGAINVDGCRVGDSKNVPRGQANMENWASAGEYDPEIYGKWGPPTPEMSKFNPDIGRWPANVVLDESTAADADAQWAERIAHGDSPSKFFYCAKTSRAERNAGLEGFPADRLPDEGYGTIQQPKADRQSPRENWEPHASANVHPTVKPIALMRWLCRLVTPPGGTILDPFTGSGSTGCAAVLEGFEFIGCEREAEYVAIAEARIAWWAEHPEGVELVDRLRAENERRQISAAGQDSLFPEAA